MLEQFKEFDDRYEKEFNVNSINIPLSVDKDAVSDLTENILSYVVENMTDIVDLSLNYFNENRESYEIDYVDDLSSPQILLAEDGYSIYWYSEKGEEEGEAIIGVDFKWPENNPTNITIGD